MEKSKHQSVTTRFLNDGSIFFSYIDAEKNVYEIKKATVKYFNGIAFLGGISKDNLLLCYSSDIELFNEKKEVTGHQLHIEVVPNYSEKDKLKEVHTKMTSNNESLVKDCLKKAIIDRKLSCEQFFTLIKRNSKNKYCTSIVYNTETNFATAVAFSNNQEYAIKQVLEKSKSTSLASNYASYIQELMQSNIACDEHNATLDNDDDGNDGLDN